MLGFKQECMLKTDERRTYLEEIRSELKNRKTTNTTFGATLWGPKLYGITCWLANKVARIFISKDTIIEVDYCDKIPGGAVLFAYNHQGILDNFISIPHTSRHCLILHGAEVNKLLIAAQLNTGLIKVIKGDRENNFRAKKDAITHLLNGHSITWFPEGTWNLSNNKLLLPERFGFLDVARLAKVPVIPVALYYHYDLNDEQIVISKVRIKFGEQINVADYDNLDDKLIEYEEKMCTMIYQLMEERGMFSRKNIDIDKEYAKFLEMSFKNLKLGKLNWKKEKENIFGAENDFYNYFNINEYEYRQDYIEKDLPASIRYYRKFI